MKKYFLFSVVFLFLNLRIVSAQIPECTYPIISSCPCNITLSGVWYQLNDTIYSNGTCIYVGKNEVAINCNHNRIVGNGSGNGLDIRDKMVIYIANCSIENFKYGIYGVRSSYIKIASSIFKNNYIGVKAEGNDHYYIGHNIFTNNSIGLYLVSDQSIVWDNYFSKNKIYNVLDASSILWRNSWNITKSTQDPFWPKRQAPNIIHGPFLGGNYYNITDYNGTDEDGDGLGEEIYYPPPAWYPENISDQHPLVDNIGPKYKELSIQGDSIYSPNKLYEFSITFEDNAELNEVFFELDNVNYTPEKEGEYLGFDSDLRVLHSVNYSIKFTGLGAGTHYYRWYGSDPRNNQNSTELISFTVEKATPILHLEINGNESDQILPYGSLVNVTAWVELEDSQDMNFNLYLNDTLIGSGNLISEQYYLSPGVYLYTYNTTGNANYSSNSISRMVIIKDNIPPYYSNIIEPQDPSFYNPSATYTFKIDWFDDVEVDKVILEMDGKNYTPTKSGNTYSFTFSSCPMSSNRGGGGGGFQIYMMSFNPFPFFKYLINLLTGRIVKGEEMPCLGVGIHYYKWYANDTSNNWNSTPLLNFTIREKDPLIIHIFSPENKTYSTQNISISYSIENGDVLHWIGYSLDDKPNVTLTGNTSIIVSEGLHAIKFYANNTYGISNSSEKIYFTVSLPKPDLIIEDIWLSGNTIYYRIKNKGNAIAGYSYSKLFIDGYYKSLDYCSSLQPNSYSNEYFSYYLDCSNSNYTIKICADSYDYVKESDEFNNCLTKTINCSPQNCICTDWEPLGCCYSTLRSTQLWIRSCFPKGCAVESKCEGPCFDQEFF